MKGSTMIRGKRNRRLLVVWHELFKSDKAPLAGIVA
jgi:hypothetical protein